MFTKETLHSLLTLDLSGHFSDLGITHSSTLSGVRLVELPLTPQLKFMSYFCAAATHWLTVRIKVAHTKITRRSICTIMRPSTLSGCKSAVLAK